MELVTQNSLDGNKLCSGLLSPSGRKFQNLFLWNLVLRFHLLDSRWRSFNIKAINSAGSSGGTEGRRIPNPGAASDDKDFCKADGLAIEAEKVEFVKVGFGIGARCVQWPVKESAQLRAYLLAPLEECNNSMCYQKTMFFPILKLYRLQYFLAISY